MVFFFAILFVFDVRDRKFYFYIEINMGIFWNRDNIFFKNVLLVGSNLLLF